MWKLNFSNDDGGPLESVLTDQQGRYELTYIKEDYCPEGLFNLVASANGYISVRYNTISIINDSTVTPVRCTEELQTINFQLEKI